jgi:hypothetical protein
LERATPSRIFLKWQRQQRWKGIELTKQIALTDHAKVALEERSLELAWVERTAHEPEWTEAEPTDPTLERRFRAVPERDGRILRVVCGEDDATITIVTAFLDRRARRPT